MGAGLATPIPPTAFRVLETGRKVPVESNKFQTLGAFRVQHVSNTGLLLTESGASCRILLRNALMSGPVGRLRRQFCTFGKLI